MSASQPSMEQASPLPANDTMPRLWTAANLATFLGYKESTVVRLASQHPEKLSPRVQGLGKPRWVPGVCIAWVRERSVASEPKVRRGRPRRRD